MLGLAVYLGAKLAPSPLKKLPSEPLAYFKFVDFFSGWREKCDPIMCSYKAVEVRLEVWGLQTRVEDFIHKVRIFYSHHPIPWRDSISRPIASVCILYSTR
jgi:hypothetical protein